MYEKCITCDHVDGCPHSPRFYSMTPEEVLDWCRRRKKYLRLTNEDIARKSGVPAGTIARLFAEHSTLADYKHSTIQPLLAALTGNSLCEPPCPTKEDPETIEKIRADYQRKIDHLNAEIADFKEELSFKRQQLRSAHTGRIIMTVLFIAALLVIIAALVVDHLNPDMGFFWLDKLSATFGSGVNHSGGGIKTLLGL